MPSPNSTRAAGARSPSPTRQAPCNRPLVPMQRPPNKHLTAFMRSSIRDPSAAPVPGPPATNCPPTMPRPSRSEALMPCQRPPRTEAPAPGLITPPSPLVSTRSDYPCSLQRPPRIKAPLPMDRTCSGEPAVMMKRPQNTEHSVPLERPPRIKLTAANVESPASFQIPIKRVPLVQRPPRTNPPCPIMRPDMAECPDRNDTSAKTISNANGADSTVGHKKAVPANMFSENSNKKDLSNPESDQEKTSPGFQTPGKSLAVAEAASLSVEADSSAGVSLVQPRQPNEKVQRDLSKSDDLEDDTGLFIPMEDQDSEDGEQKKKKGRMSLKRKREDSQGEGEAVVSTDLENPLDRCLEDRAKLHNLTAVNVRNILHEVITNEHVVAMMKAAITDTPDLPIFEPKMTRSKLKEVVEKGVVIPTWNLSPIKKVGELKVPQFVDIPLEEEDSSDEEYRPDEEDEDETAEESLLESDVESTGSSPRGHKRPRVHYLSETTEEEEAVECPQAEKAATEITKHVETGVTLMGPPPPPSKIKCAQDSTFMDELHAVDEELNSSMVVCMDSYQAIEDSLIAFRTRSKRPLKGVRIGQLEAKLNAPDITPDMYDPNTADDEDWKLWLQSLMQDDVGNEDEADDDDDPEYNFLEDMDEPDTEDLRNDRAVRITKKEVSELMEELFETFQDEMGYSNVEDEDSNLEVPPCKSRMEEEETEDDDSQRESINNFNTPQAIRFEEPLANILNEQHRTIKAHLQFLRMKKSVLKSSAQDEDSKDSHAYPTKAAPVFALDAGQKKRLQQQMQQHVQLLTQVHLLAFRNPRLNSEAETTHMFLFELSNFAENSALVHHTENLAFQSAFHASNLKDAIELLNGVPSNVPEIPEQPKTRKNVSEIPCLPADIAWVLATQPVCMYPELLPVCGLKARGPRARVFFTKAEDSLLALGMKHFEGTEFTKTLISKYLVPAKTSQQLNARIKNLTMNKSPDNIVKYYKKTKSLPATVKCCDVIQSYDGKPPVEREKHRLPYWLKASLTSIEAETEKLEKAGPISGGNERRARYPLLMPPELTLTFKPLPKRYYFKAWRHRRPALQPLLIRPNGSINSPNKNAFKQHSVVQSVPITILSGIPSFIQSPRPVQGFVGVNPLSGEVRSSHLSSSTQNAVVSPFPVLQTKMALPLTSLRVQKPRTKSLLKTTCSRSTPPIQAPVLFSVPNGALKLVNLGTSCGVIQPLGARQGIPVTTVLLNPSSAPLNQALLTSNFNQTIYDVSTVIPEDQSSVVLEAVASDDAKPEEPIKPFMDAAGHDHVWDCVSITIKVEEGSSVDGETSPTGEEETTNSGDGSPVVEGGCLFHSDNERPPSSESKPAQGDGCAAGLGFSGSLSNDIKNGLEFQSDRTQTFQAVGIQSPKEPEVKKDLKEFNVGVSDSLGTRFVENILPGNGKPLQESMKEEKVLEQDADKFGSSRSQLLNAMTSTPSESDRPADPDTETSQPDNPADLVGIAQPDQVTEPANLRDLVHPAALPESSRPAEPVDFATDRPAEPEDVQDENRDKTGQQRPVLEAKESEANGSPTQGAGVQGEASQNIPTSVECDVDRSGPSDSTDDPTNPLGQQQGSNEKDIPEDEEEEDFDDLTQDEDEEEMSSASEESVLSVPELQETMEKLTWLASERRLSQEGDSEENSQEENSEPEEEEEEEEVEGTDGSMRKEEELTDEVTTEITTPAPSHPHIPSPVPMEHVAAPAGEGRKGGSKGRTTHRVRSRRGRARTSKDASKLLLLYDENILLKDPLREQKDMAFAQEYLNRVRDALQAVPGKYEQFLHLIYQFETNKHTKTAVDLYENLRDLLCGWPQLIKDFAAFLLPEQALECGLFQEQQAFEKSRKFLRQLEICFLENPAQHQKIIKLLQSFPDCSLEEISKLKAQMWQLLKGHNHLQEEFSVFFDHLRPPSSRMGEFEVLHWTEDKEYKFDGFEEVSLPDVDDEEEVSKAHPPQRGKRKKEAHQGQEVDWLDGGKDCPCSCHEVGVGEQRLKRCKRRMCSHCSTKVCENRVYRSRETPEVASAGPQGVLRSGPPVKEVGNCEGRLSFPKGTAAADRLAAGGKGTNVPKGSSTSEYAVNTSKSCTASQSRSATAVDGADCRSQKPHTKDRPGLTQRSGRKSTAAKGPDPTVPSEKAVEISSDQPYSPPFPSASSSLTAAGEDGENPTGCAPSSSTQKNPDSVSAVDLLIQEKEEAPTPHTTKSSEKEEQMLTVCAKNITVSSSGEKVILWTREADRVILTMCQERGAQDETFAAISLKLGNKSPDEVCQRFKELVNLFQAACATSSDDEEEATEQISDLEAPHSEED